MASDDELLRRAAEMEDRFLRRERSMENYRYDEYQDKYWDVTTGFLLTSRAVDSAIPADLWPTGEDDRGRVRPIKPSVAILRVEAGLTVETSTWWPGKPQFIENVVMTDRGMLRTKGAVTLNTYGAPDHSHLRTDRNPDQWIAHVRRLFPNELEHEHFFDYAAHMMQRPHEKVNHGIIMAGAQGIGKDTALLPVRHGVGEHNCAEIGPDALFRQYNDFARSVLMIVNEVRPEAEDHKASAFYNILKPYLAAPPELIPLEMKYANRSYIRNVCRAILTTNEPLGMYIPEEDRRFFVMTSPLADPKVNKVFSEDYFKDLYAYLNDGGRDAAIRWLLNRDLGAFDAGAPPAMTVGKRAIIDSATQVRSTPASEFVEHHIEDCYNGKRPQVIFGADLVQWLNAHPGHFDDEDIIRKGLSAKNFHFKMDELGYTLKRCPTGPRWRHGKFESRAAYVLKTMPDELAIAAVYRELGRRPLEFRQEVAQGVKKP